jgi:hypothetical protein
MTINTLDDRPQRSGRPSGLNPALDSCRGCARRGHRPPEVFLRGGVRGSTGRSSARQRAIARSPPVPVAHTRRRRSPRTAATQAQEAEQQARAVLEIRTRLLGPEHPDTAYTRSLLASIEGDPIDPDAESPSVTGPEGATPQSQIDVIGAARAE